jgi:hypothetical protein
MLQGMTDSKAEDLVPLAKSWFNAPELVISSEGFKGGIYDEAERAFVVEKRNGNNTSLNLIIKATEESPLVNPAFIIKNWGNQLSTIKVDEKSLVQGKDFKQGIRKTSEGDDLILWLRLNRIGKVEITVD